MSVMIQVRHVDESVHRKLKARAAMSGMSLSDYLRKEIQNIAARPSKEEIGRASCRERVYVLV